LIDDSLREYLPFFDEQKVAVISASGHGMGLLTNDGPQPWHPAQKEVKGVCKEAGDYCRANDVELGKLAMWHFVQMQGPATFLVGMQTLELLNINLDAYFNGLTAKEEEILKYLNEKLDLSCLSEIYRLMMIFIAGFSAS
jgi:aryl-alcohol dehydrogenase-like predicted oxidoreductase